MLKLKIYKFLGKFILYFNLKFHKMSFIQINQNVINVLSRFNYVNINEDIIVNNTISKNFKIVYGLELKNRPYCLYITIEYLNHKLQSYSYDVYIKDEKVGITSDILIELNPIDSDMNSIRNDLSKIFSIM